MPVFLLSLRQAPPPRSVVTWEFWAALHYFFLLLLCRSKRRCYSPSIRVYTFLIVVVGVAGYGSVRMYPVGYALLYAKEEHDLHDGALSSHLSLPREVAFFNVPAGQSTVIEC